MKASQFKEIIRQMIREEIKNTLPVLLPQIMAEAFSKNSGGQIVPSQKNNDIFEELKNEIDAAKLKPKPTPTPSQPKKYTNNPLLNQVLNETVGGVVPDVEFGQSVPTPSFRQPAHNMHIKKNEPTIITEDTKSQAQIGVYKDYRKLMKAIDKKKTGGYSGGGMGPLMIEGVSTDFTQTD